MFVKLKLHLCKLFGTHVLCLYNGHLNKPDIVSSITINQAYIGCLEFNQLVMNYLAHLHIAEQSDSNLLGNLLGDFVKGDPSKQYEVDVVQGIRLHRWVDAYTDSHCLMSESKAKFTSRTRRFSPIALDMFWDHFLAKHWNHFHCATLAEFNAIAENQVKHDFDSVTQLPERFLVVTEKMWRGRWLESYRELDNIQFALQRMSLRSTRMKPLAECYQSLVENYAFFENIFFDLYPDVLSKAKTIVI